MTKFIALFIFSKIKATVKLDYDDDVYIYGLEIFISNFASIFVIIALSVVLNEVVSSLIFLTIIVVIRSLTGGFHAKTHLKCSLSFFFCYGCFELILHNFTQYDNIIVFSLIWLISILIIAMFAPVENKAKKLKDFEKSKFKILSLTYASLLMPASVILFSFSSYYAYALVYSIASVSALIILEKALKFNAQNSRRK